MNAKSILMLLAVSVFCSYVGGGCARAIDKDLVSAAYAGDVHQIEALITAGANPNKLAVDGWNPLSVASREGHIEAVSALLRLGADVNAPEGGGNTALFWAAFYDRLDVVKLLIAKDADVNKKDRNGETPLHVAHRLGHTDTAEVLREAGARE